MVFDRIELFVNVAKHQNLAKTARMMHVSPSSITQRLKFLEKDFGAKLYRKNKDGIELTNAGRALLSTAHQVLNQLDTLRKSLSLDSEKVAQTLSVAGTFNPSAKHLPSAIAAFIKIHPEIKVTFITASRNAVEKSIRDGESDVAIVQSPSESCMLDFFTEHFAVDRLVFFAHPGHPLTRKQKIGFEDLANTPLVIGDGRAATRSVLGSLRSRHLKVNIALRCATPDAVKAAVRRKMGIGILLHDLVEEDVRRKDFKILRVAGLPASTASSYIVYDKAKPLNHPATEFVALLRDMKSRQNKLIEIRRPASAE